MNKEEYKYTIPHSHSIAKIHSNKNIETSVNVLFCRIITKTFVNVDKERC